MLELLLLMAGLKHQSLEQRGKASTGDGGFALKP